MDNQVEFLMFKLGKSIELSASGKLAMVALLAISLLLSLGFLGFAVGLYLRIW